MRVVIILLSLALLAGCNKKKFFAGPNSYSDDFENYATFDDAIDGENLRWSFTQLTRNSNSIVLSSEQAHSGTYSLKFFAESGTSADASKCSVSKQKMAFFEGETVQASVWYYIEGTQQLDWMFLIDLEEQTSIGAGPGMRVANTENNFGVLEFKYPVPNIYQETYSFPRNQWFKITLETKLSRKKKGWAKVYQDGELIIDKSGFQTLPKDVLYNAQGAKGMYTSIEIGITANSHDNPATIYADDFSIKVID